MYSVRHELIESQQHKYIEYKLWHAHLTFLTENGINCDNLPTLSNLVVFFQSQCLLGCDVFRVSLFILANR